MCEDETLSSATLTCCVTCSPHLQVLPDLYKHMLAVSYQMAAVLDVFAMAHALDRTAVLPKFWCWCDTDWYAVVLDGCAMGGRPGRNGADLFSMPFECPIDVILNPHVLYHQKIEYRQERFLHDRRTPLAVQHSREPILVLDQRDTVAAAARQRMVGHTFSSSAL
jgi:hypothetical protein